MKEVDNEQIENAQSQDDKPVDSSSAPEVETTNETEVEASATESTEAKKPNKVQARINQLTREKYEARQANEALEKRIKDLETQKPKEAKVIAKAPNESDFDDFDDYQVAHSEYVANNAANVAYERISSENKARDDSAYESEKIRELKAKKSAFDQNLDKKRGNFEDFEEIAYGHKFMDENIASRIFDMQKGPEVAYHLGSHLDVAEKIFAMPKIDQAVELAKIEMQVQSLSPKVVSDAPDSITPIQGQEKVFDDPDKMNADQWAAWRNKDLESKGLL